MYQTAGAGFIFDLSLLILVCAITAPLCLGRAWLQGAGEPQGVWALSCNKTPKNLHSEKETQYLRAQCVTSWQWKAASAKARLSILWGPSITDSLCPKSPGQMEEQKAGTFFTVAFSSIPKSMGQHKECQLCCGETLLGEESWNSLILKFNS